MTRAFVAVRPPDDVLDAVAARVDRLSLDGLRFTTRAQWHLTLQFLGNRADIDAVTGALDGLDVPASTVRFGGAGAFASARRGRVLWIGVCAGGEFLVRLASAVGERLAPLGYAPESRPYHPHLTLARAKTPIDLRAAVEALGDAPAGDPFRVDEVVVYESRLRRTGAEYEPRARLALGA